MIPQDPVYLRRRVRWPGQSDFPPCGNRLRHWFWRDGKSEVRQSERRELLAQVEPEDLIKFGLIPEFIGRLPVVATLNELSEEA